MKRCPQCNRAETDDALKFCRVDGTTLINDSTALAAESATAKLGSVPLSGEIETNILPHTTSGTINRGTGPTSALPLPAAASTGRLTKSARSRNIVIAIAALVILAAGIAVFSSFYLSRRNNATIQSIAVMPFVNEGGNADLEYLSDGITDTLISRLSQLPNLNVKARSSVFRYKGKETSPQTIGRDLNVQAIVNGRVAQRGDQLMRTLELVNTQTENVMWSEQYNRKSSDLLFLQTEIARDVSTKLKTKLSGADEQKLAKTYTNNPEAYQLYLKGTFYLGRRTAADMKRGLEYFQQAIDLDPNYALAYVGLSDAYKLPATYGLVPTREGYPRAKAAAQKALQIDDSVAAAHAALGDVAASYDWDWTVAERELKRAIDLDPNSAGAHLAYAFSYLCPMRRFDEAVSEAKRAQQLEPLSLSINTNLGAVLTTARRYDEAIAQLQKTVELDPNFVTAHWRLALAYSCVGRHTEAIAEAKRAFELAPDLAWSKSVVAQMSARAGDKDTALKLIDEIKKMPPNNTSYMIALDYACLGQKDRAFEWLNKAYESKDWSLNRVGVEPWIDNIGSDPRLADLLKRMNLPE
ncbi:MAG TPA: tetratricopeptide repeat protein [Pyrinomonadaceae bacterium]|jgi:TolB-like protein/Flp pilus assembly protein TadD|nr:tetratricopeptide repeat protein [Pyrinomonadaceae bacterium]